MSITYADLKAAIDATGAQSTDTIADVFGVVNSETPKITRRVDPVTGVATIWMTN